MPAPRIARTVLGDIPIAELGITMCHEHLLVDQRSVTFSEPEDRRDQELARRPVSLEIFGWVQWNWTHNLDNLVLDDEVVAIAEAKRDGRILVGGEVLGGHATDLFAAPTIVADLPADHRIWREELFVPLVAVAKGATLDEAIERASDTTSGLTAGIGK